MTSPCCPARDSDKFLSLDVARGASFDTFEVVAALSGGATTGASPRPFVLSASAYLIYPSRAAPDADCAFVAAEFAGGVPATTASGCLVEALENLTPEPLAAGGTGLAGEWPAGIEAPRDPDAIRVTRWWNTHFALRVPRLDVHDFNQRFVASRDRERMLDEYAAYRARIVLALSLTAPTNQQDAALVFPGVTYAPIPLPAHAAAPGQPSAPSSVENARVGTPTAVFVPLDTLIAAIEGREGALTSAVYYRTVDPDRTRASLNAWLRQAGFTAADGTLLPEAVAGTGQFAHAVYLNNFDLGFGRQMFTRTDEFGNVFSFVKNYGTLEGAIRQQDSFATVVTEYSPLGNHSDASSKFVKFFTFVEDGSGDAPRVASFDFDGRGERFTPGNCVVCHGGARPPGVSELGFDATCGDPSAAACYSWPLRNRDGVGIADGDLGGTLLPWDVGSLLFADTDPAITQAPLKLDRVTLADELRLDYGDHSQNREADQLKKLNQTVYRTYAAANAGLRRLVESWYGGVDQNGALVGAFDESATIAGWRNGDVVPDPSPTNIGGMVTNPSTAEELYHSVFARHCRMCHTSMPDGPLRFDNYQKFVFQRDAIRQTVFRAGTMPGARLTMDRLWAPFDGGAPPGEHLAEYMGTLRGEPPDARPSAAVAAIIGLEPASRRGDTVYLDGSDSVFASSYAWTLSAPAGSAATLSEPNARETAFVLDLPGAYEVTLTVNAGAADQASVTKSIAVANRAPVAADDLYSLDLTSTLVLTGSVLAGALPDSDSDGDALTAALAAGGAPSHGTVIVGLDGSFKYTYTGVAPPPAGTDTFRYQIADGFGATATGTVTILLNGAASGARPAAVTSLSAVDASTATGGSSVFRVQLGWLASEDDVQVVGYNVYRDGALLGTLASTAPPGTPVAYTDGTINPGTTHVYRVTALDADSESDLSEERTVSVAVSLRRSIQTGWGTGADSLWRVTGCIGCHRADAGGLTLSGTPDAVVAELLEDATDVHPHRVEAATPLRSLLLCKPLIKSDPNSCPHEGGPFFVESDPRFQTLKRWVEANVPNN